MPYRSAAASGSGPPDGRKHTRFTGTFPVYTWAGLASSSAYGVQGLCEEGVNHTRPMCHALTRYTVLWQSSLT